MRVPLFQVDAFASRLFQGNPAAVCPLSAWLDARVLQAIAAENNLSETAFFVPRGGDFELRWFTPTVEVDLCGHATLAAAHVLFRHLQPGRAAVVFHSQSGPLPVALTPRGLELAFPSRPALPLTEGQAHVVAALGARPAELLAAPRDYLVVFDTAAEVRALRPDFARLAALPKSGLIASAPGEGEGCDFVSRFFSPKDGINEDPVTGSAHCTLAPYWAHRLGRADLSARQLSARGGELGCTVDGERVKISGEAITYLTGELQLP